MRVRPSTLKLCESRILKGPRREVTEVKAAALAVPSSVNITGVAGTVRLGRHTPSLPSVTRLWLLPSGRPHLEFECNQFQTTVSELFPQEGAAMQFLN